MPDPVVAVVGAGQAGFQAASSLRQEGFAGRVVLIGEEPVLPYQRPPLSKSYLAGASGLDELWLRPGAFYEKQKIVLVIGETVRAIDRAGRRLRLASGRAVECDHVVLATGARCRLLPVPGADLDGVLPLRTLADADALRDRLRRARDVVVVGAGFIGLEFAAVAIAAGAAVHIIEITHHPMGRVVSAHTSRFFTEAHRAWGATISLGTGVARILGDSRVSAVETSDGRKLPADLVLICIGVVPNTDLAAAAGLAVDNGIAVDDCLRTAVPEITAIGDCANFPTPFAKGRVRLESVQNGVDQGREVAAHIAGKRNAAYDKVPWFWSDQRDLKLQIAGLTAGHEKAVLRGNPESGSFSVFCYRGDWLLGVESINRPADHMVARRLLATGPQLSPVQAADESYDLKAHVGRSR